MVPKGWLFNPFAIINEREWLYTGTRFVSPMSLDAQNVVLFECRETAVAYAMHLRLTGVVTGTDPMSPVVRVRHPGYSVIRNAKYPPIPRPAPKAPKVAQTEP